MNRTRKGGRRVPKTNEKKVSSQLILYFIRGNEFKQLSPANISYQIHFVDTATALISYITERMTHKLIRDVTYQVLKFRYEICQLLYEKETRVLYILYWKTNNVLMYVLIIKFL